MKFRFRLRVGCLLGLSVVLVLGGCAVQDTDFTGKSCQQPNDCPAPFVCGSAGVCQRLEGQQPGGCSAGAELTCPSPVPTVSATDVQRQLMDPVCNNCHAPGGGGVGAPFEWDTVDKTLAAVGQASSYRPLKVVDASNSDPSNNLRNSSLYLKSIGGRGPNCQSVGGRMPQSPYPPLSAAQTEVLKNWICGGARR
jgi:hypothetical protein